jgi:NAD(P)-dependent dehydrogenase (short-subunit alcohol dehydrogenase family)
MKRVLITGANRGIGLALVEKFVERGDRVFAGYRSLGNSPGLEDLATQYPNGIDLVQLDVIDQASIEKSVQLVKERVEGLDILINNAAIHLGDEKLSEVESGELLELLQVNAVGPILVAQGFIHLLEQGDQPLIINISSEAGSVSKMNNFRGYGYYGSKAAENMYTRALAFDPETAGITVIAIHPGWVRTEMGGPEAPLSVSESAAGILKVIDGLTPQDNGKFFTWEGMEYPW